MACQQGNPDVGPDEVDLIELCADIWQRRLPTVLCALSDSLWNGLRVLAPQVYRAEGVSTRPQQYHWLN